MIYDQIRAMHRKLNSFLYKIVYKILYKLWLGYFWKWASYFFLSKVKETGKSWSILISSGQHDGAP